MELMEWTELLGNIGEFLGSLAVMVTLIVLVVQVRQGAKAVAESNQLQRVAALDRHSDSIGEWRSQIAANLDIAGVWHAGREDAELDPVAHLRMNFLWINLINTQRSNYTRAVIIGELGLARQAVLSVAAEIEVSDTFRNEWTSMESWLALASPEYVREVNVALQNFAQGPRDKYQVGSRAMESIGESNSS